MLLHLQSFIRAGRRTVLTRISLSCPFPPCTLPVFPITPAATRDTASCALHRDRASSLALPAVHITAKLCQLLHSRLRAIAVLTADEGMATEGLGLTDNTFWLQGVRRADALPCHLVAESCPTVTGCKRQKGGVFGKARATQPKEGTGQRRLCRGLGCLPEAVSGLENASVSNSVFAPKEAKQSVLQKAGQETGQLTPAVGEAPVAGGAAGALSPDDIGLAGTLPTKGLALAAPCPRLMALAGLCPIVVEEGQRDGGVTAKPRRCAGTAEEGRRNRHTASPPPQNPAGSLISTCAKLVGWRAFPNTLRFGHYIRKVLNRDLPTVPVKGTCFCSPRSVQPPYSTAAIQSQAPHLM